VTKQGSSRELGKADVQVNSRKTEVSVRLLTWC